MMYTLLQRYTHMHTKHAFDALTIVTFRFQIFVNADFFLLYFVFFILFDFFPMNISCSLSLNFLSLKAQQFPYHFLHDVISYLNLLRQREFPH